MKKLILFSLVITLSFSVIYAQSSDSSKYYFEKGIVEKDSRRFREAEKNFAKALEYAPESTEIHLELANALLKQNRYVQAREVYLKAEKTAKNHPAIIENLATLNFNTRKFDEAIIYAKKMQELKIDKPVNFIIGKSYAEQGNYGEGLKYLQLAAKEEPQRAEIYYTMAKAYADMSNYRLSAANFEKAIALDDTKPYWIYEASLIFYAIPDYKKSLEYMELAGAKGLPKSNDYMENLGNAYLNVKQYDKGISILKEVLVRKPMDQELLYQIAQAHYDSKKYQEAIDYWDQVLTNDKTHACALYMIGLSYQKKGDKQKGQHLCDAAIKMDPSLSSLKQKQGGMEL